MHRTSQRAFLRKATRGPHNSHRTPANVSNTLSTSLGSSVHFASVPLLLVDTVSTLSSSFSLLNNFSSPPMASTSVDSSVECTLRTPPPEPAPRPTAPSCPSYSVSPTPAPPPRGEHAGPPGCMIAPTAVEREILFGRTRKEFCPGMMRRPYRSPRESKMWF